MLKIIFKFDLDQTAGCNCSSFTTESCDKKGCKTYGNCIGRKPICYVNEPSNCPRYSSKACRDIKFRRNYNYS